MSAWDCFGLTIFFDFAEKIVEVIRNFIVKKVCVVLNLINPLCPNQRISPVFPVINLTKLGTCRQRPS